MTTTMQLEQKTTTPIAKVVSVKKIQLPSGLRGFPALTEIELVNDPEEHPFMWLRTTEDSGLRFLVAEPANLFQDYTIELFDEDVREIGIQSEDDLQILNILTLVEGPQRQLYANQVGPIVINRKTGLGKQVIIQNYQEYSPRLALLS